MRIAGWAPIPSDAIVTPVSFRVTRQSLKGILAIADSGEKGSRKLQGEWIVGKQLWQNLRKKSKERSVHSRHDQPQVSAQDRIIFYLHGGAFAFK